jgi:hypothetical protein
MRSISFGMIDCALWTCDPKQAMGSNRPKVGAHVGMYRKAAPHRETLSDRLLILRACWCLGDTADRVADPEKAAQPTQGTEISIARAVVGKRGQSSK